MVGRSDGEQRSQDFEGRTARQVEVKARQVAFPVYRLHIALLHHCRKDGFHSRQRQRQERAAMGHDYFQVRIAHQHVPCQHIHHGAGGLRRIFIHRQRRGGDDSFRTRRGAVRMDDDDGVPLVQDFHQRVQFFVAKILPPAVGRQLHAVRSQGVERIDGFADGSVHVGQRQGGAELEPTGIIRFQPGAMLIITACCLLTFFRIVEIRLRGRHRQDGASYASLLHELQMRTDIPRRKGKAFVHRGIVLLQCLHIKRQDIMAMHINNALCHHVSCHAR